MLSVIGAGLLAFSAGTGPMIPGWALVADGPAAAVGGPMAGATAEPPHPAWAWPGSPVWHVVRELLLDRLTVPLETRTGRPQIWDRAG